MQNRNRSTVAAVPDPLRRALPRGATLSTWHAADGWPLRRFDWPHPSPRGRLLFQAGRADAIEKYLEVAGHFHRQGWAVAAFDWRGQGGSGRLVDDANVGHADDFRPWIDDLAGFWADWSRQGVGPRAIVAHSMGGFLALSAMARGAIDPDAAILVAPMLGLRSPVGALLGSGIARCVARYASTRPAWRESASRGLPHRRRLFLTHDAERYEDERWWHRRDPGLRLGPPSWGWIDRAFAETRALAADPRLDTLATPILMLVADHDRLVDARAAAAVAARLPNGEIVRFGAEAAHEILREADPVRDRALAAIDGFLDRQLPT